MNDTRLYYASASTGTEPVKELSVVALTMGKSVEPVGYLPEGSLGAVVFVHNEGEAYEVEFAHPVSAVLTLTEDDFRLIEGATREHVIATSGYLLHRHRKD